MPKRAFWIEDTWTARDSEYAMDSGMSWEAEEKCRAACLQRYDGEVIGATDSFWEGPRLTVACDDGCVRAVGVDKVRVVT